jgi:phosphomannomutase
LTDFGPGSLDERDGLKWTGERSWIHIRASNTEPVLRLIAEAESEDAARALIERVRRAL